MKHRVCAALLLLAFAAPAPLPAGEPGRMTVQPLEDPAHVDPRRAAMGLLPLADYLRITNGYYANKNASSGPAPASSSPHS
jgi:hypothetical protein